MLLRRTLRYAPAGLAGPLIQLGTLVAWTHWLAPAELGAYALALALQDLAHLACATWWSNYVLRYLALPGSPERAAQDRTEGAVLLASCTAQGLLVAALVAALLGPDPGLVLAAALAGAGRSLVAHWTVRARAEGRPGLFALLQVGAPAAGLALGLAAFAGLGAGAAAAFAGSAAAHLLVAAAALPGLRLGAPRFDAATARGAARFGLLAALGSGLAWASLHGVRFTAEAMLGTAAVGLLSAGWTLGQRLAGQIAATATTAALPLAVARARAAETREAGLRAGLDALAEGALLLLAVAVPAALGLALVAGPAAAVLTAEPYRAATAAILPVAMLAGSLGAFRYHVLDEVLQLAERPGTMLRLDALEAAATLALCALGTALHGLLGGALGCLAAAAATTALALAVAARDGFRLPASRLAPIGLAAAAMAATVLALPAPAGPGELALTVAAAAAVYALALGALEWVRIRGRRGRALAA